MLNKPQKTETIAAIATPPGVGGVGIIRVSGPLVESISNAITKILPKPRYAYFSKFYDKDERVLDEGIALFFKAPNSFTGEDVLELQGHGGPVILDCLLKTIVGHGARLANPGEFSERAFLNNKIDLTQAEAIADLISASSEKAARSAIRSLQGEFSKKINVLVEALIHLRIYVEAAIDFPEEEIDFLADGHIKKLLEQIKHDLAHVKASAKQGAILQEGMTVVIAGEPNVGKSSLLNALSGKESAIVTNIAGTTRDILKEQIDIDGMPLHIIDTAGLRESDDIVEQEGIRRAKKAIEAADEILLMVDDSSHEQIDLDKYWEDNFKNLNLKKSITLIKNKIDKTEKSPVIQKENKHDVICISAKENKGIDLLKKHLKEKMGYKSGAEGTFIARRRHLNALDRADALIQNGEKQLLEFKAGELLAEDLRQAQNALSEITGEFTSDDLLGRIFSSFCIGK